MAAINPRGAGPVQPPGVEGDGMDPYPTYRDGAVPPHVASGTKPTDTNLPLRRRTSAWPMLIGLALIGAAVLAYLLIGGFNTVRTTDDAMTPGDAAAPVAPAATAPQGDAQSAPTDASGPGEVLVTPSVTDVPGGETTTPVQTAPAQ